MDLTAKSVTINSTVNTLRFITQKGTKTVPEVKDTVKVKAIDGESLGRLDVDVPMAYTKEEFDAIYGVGAFESTLEKGFALKWQGALNTMHHDNVVEKLMPIRTAWDDETAQGVAFAESVQAIREKIVNGWKPAFVETEKEKAGKVSVGETRRKARVEAMLAQAKALAGKIDRALLKLSLMSVAGATETEVDAILEEVKA